MSGRASLSLFSFRDWQQQKQLRYQFFISRMFEIRESRIRVTVARGKRRQGASWILRSGRRFSSTLPCELGILAVFYTRQFLFFLFVAFFSNGLLLLSTECPVPYNSLSLSSLLSNAKLLQLWNSKTPFGLSRRPFCIFV